MERQLILDGAPYTIAPDSGRRSYLQRTRASQPTDPGRLLIRQWALAGPMGQSRQAPNGYLGVDFVDNLDHRWPNLLTSAPAVSTITLSGQDPLSSASSALGGFALGAAALGGGTSLATAQTITHIRESQGYIFVARGAFSTMVNSSFALVETETLDGTIRGMERWFGTLKLPLGSTATMQQVASVTATGATYADVGTVNAKAIVLGNDRCWFVDASSTNDNRLRYTFDDFANLSNAATDPIPGDPDVASTNVGVLGPYTYFATERGLYAVAERTPANAISAIKEAQSQDNGRSMAEQWGWNYVATVLGLYAVRPGVANPVGPGVAMPQFEGWEGRPLAVLAWREYVIVAYLDSAGTTTHLVLGTFGPETGATGQPEWYGLRTRSAEVRAISATSPQLTTNPYLVWGEGASTLARVLMGRGGRDISDANYVYSTGGGTWHGSTLEEHRHLRKTLRWGRFFSESLVSGDSWTLAVSMDEGAYANVGSAVTSNGSQKRVPATPGSAPSGYTCKPRLTQVAGGTGSSTSPPLLRGTLELAFDERPDTVIEVAATLKIDRDPQWLTLFNLADGEHATGDVPVTVRLPGESTDRQAYITEAEMVDAKGDGVRTVTLSIVCWETS